MEKDSNGEIGAQNKSRIYLIIGYILLIAMALCWSVDASLVYIFFGLGAFFSFLGFYVRPRKNNVNSFRPTGRSAFSIFFSETDPKKQSQPRSKSTTTTADPRTTRRIATFIILGIFAIFIVFFVGTILSSSNALDATYYYQIAEQNYWNGNYDSAYANYRNALRLNEKYPEALVGYGNVLSARAQPDSALIMYDKALEINPDYKEASYFKASMYYNTERYNESIAVLKPLLENNQDYYDAMLLIGDDYYVQKQYDDAITWYEKAYTDGEQRSRNLCHIMAYIYDTKGDYSKAIALYKEALSYDSTVVDIYNRLGELLPSEEGNYYRTQAVKLQQQ